MRLYEMREVYRDLARLFRLNRGHMNINDIAQHSRRCADWSLLGACHGDTSKEVGVIDNAHFVQPQPSEWMRRVDERWLHTEIVGSFRNLLGKAKQDQG